MGSGVYLKTRSIKIMPRLWVCREHAIQCNTNNCRKSRDNQQNAIENRHIEHICVTHTMPNCWKGCWGEWSLLTGSLWNMLGKPWPLLPRMAVEELLQFWGTCPDQPFSDFQSALWLQSVAWFLRDSHQENYSITKPKQISWDGVTIWKLRVKDGPCKPLGPVIKTGLTSKHSHFHI